MLKRYVVRAIVPAAIGGAVVGLTGSAATDALDSRHPLLGQDIDQGCRGYGNSGSGIRGSQCVGLTGLPSLLSSIYAIWSVMFAVLSGAMVGAGVLFAAYLSPGLGNPCSGGILIGAVAVAAVHVSLAFITTGVSGKAAD